MSKPCLLFQRALDTASTDFTVGDLVLEGPTRGLYLITQIFFTPRDTTNAGSTIRIHHTQNNSEPTTSNVVMLVNVAAHSDHRGFPKSAPFDTKIVVARGS